MLASLLKKYEEYDFVYRLRARVLFGLILLTVFASMAVFVHNYFFVSVSAGMDLQKPVLALVAVLMVALAILCKGYFQAAANIIFFMTCAVIWYIMFFVEDDFLALGNTIVFVYGALGMVPLIVGRRSALVLFYFLFNIALFYAFIQWRMPEFDLPARYVTAFIFDNSLAMIFVAILAFLVISINERSLQRAEEEIEKNRAMSLSFEAQVVERTNELHAAKDDLLAAAHQAGKAEIATGVLHNIGNTLTGVFVNVDALQRTFSRQLLASIQKVGDAVKDSEDVNQYLTNNTQGKKIPSFVVALGPLLTRERQRMDAALERIEDGISLMKESVRTQQAYANSSFMYQEIDLAKEVDTMIALTISDSKGGGVVIEKRFAPHAPLIAQREKVGHIIANLIKNAFEALSEVPRDRRRITISIFEGAYGTTVLEVSDTGCGIKVEDLTRIFSFGFTTKPDGHGFGLHHCANAMTEMNGKLSVSSPGLGKGATFTMTFYRGDDEQERSTIRPDLVAP